VFLLSKRPRYFYDADAIREAHKEPNRGNGERDRVNYNTGGIIGRGRVGEYEEGVVYTTPPDATAALCGRLRRNPLVRAYKPPTMPVWDWVLFPMA
jgi:hypothetical protein